MIPINTKTAAKQQRIDEILYSLKEYDFLTRSQLQELHDLKSTRNANRFLKSMETFVSTFRHDMEYVYYLSKEGRERVNDNKIRKKTANIRHILLRNQLRIYLKNPRGWVNEVKISSGDTSIVSDAKYMMNNIPVFVEVDISQPMATNKEKIDKYKKIRANSGEAFSIVWVTELESRREKLQELMVGLTGRVYTLGDIR